MSVSIAMNSFESENEIEIYSRQPTFGIYKAKLSGVTRLMALIGGFSISAVAELKGYETASPWLVTVFSVTTVILTSMAAFVILFTASLLPYLAANEELDTTLIATGLIYKFKSHRLFYLPKELEVMAQVTWLMASTGTVFLFLVDMILITWIKFQTVSASAGTTVMTPTFLLMTYFAIRFWREFLQRRFLPKDF